jgi:hypothetical protein
MAAPSLEALHNGSLGGASSALRLERELAAGFALDKRRSAEDAMKKRAIHTAGSYDEFRHLVAAASQAPLAPADFVSRVEQGANRVFGGGGARALAAPCDLGAGGAAAAAAAAAADDAPAGAAARAFAVAAAGAPAWGAPPASCLELDRAFRRHAAARGAFLAWLGAARLGACFRRDADAPVLGVVLRTLAEEAARGGVGSDAARAAVALAAGVAAAAAPAALARAVEMLDAAEAAAAKAIVDAADSPSDADLLRRAFCA